KQGAGLARTCIQRGLVDMLPAAARGRAIGRMRKQARVLLVIRAGGMAVRAGQSGNAAIPAVEDLLATGHELSLAHAASSARIGAAIRNGTSTCVIRAVTGIGVAA